MHIPSRAINLHQFIMQALLVFCYFSHPRRHADFQTRRLVTLPAQTVVHPPVIVSLVLKSHW